MVTASSGETPSATAVRTIELMWPSSAMCSGSRSSVQNAIRAGPYSLTSGSRSRRLRAPEASRISSHMPARRRSRPSSTVRASWSERIPAEGRRRALDQARRVPSTCAAPSSRASPAALEPRHDAGKVHHLREPDHPGSPHQAFEVAGRERAARGLELRRGYARRGHEEHVQWELGARVEQPVDTVRAQHVCDLVRVGDHRRRPQRQHEAGELVGQELRRLEVQVGVDESRHDPAAGRVDRLGGLVLADPRDVAVADRDVALEPLAREAGGPSLRASVRGLVAARREAARKILHACESYYAPSHGLLTPQTFEEHCPEGARRRPSRSRADGVMVSLNFDRLRPPALLNLNEVPELKGLARENGALRLGARDVRGSVRATRSCSRLAEASRTVVLPDRSRGLSSAPSAPPSGRDGLPPLLVEAAGRAGEVRERRVRPRRSFASAPNGTRVPMTS